MPMEKGLHRYGGIGKKQGIDLGVFVILSIIGSFMIAIQDYTNFANSLFWSVITGLLVWIYLYRKNRGKLEW